MIVEKRGKWLVYDVNGNYTKYTTKEEAEKAAGVQALDQMFEYAGATDGSEKEKAHYDWLHEEKEEISDEAPKEPDTEE
jgi:hypothetical protein